MNTVLRQKEFFPAYFLLIFLIIVSFASFVFVELWVSIAIILISIISCIVSFVLANKAVKSRIVFSDFAREARDIINNLPIGVVVYDANFDVQIFNPSAEDIFGISSEEAKMQRLDASLAMDPKLQTFVRVIFSTLAPVVIKRSDPGKYPQIADIIFDDPHLELQVVTDVVYDSSNKPNGFIKLITNKTREANLIKSKTDFITVAAHQLRTPLTAVNWALEALEGSVSDSSQKELLDTAFSAVKNSLKIVNDLLDVSKIEEGHFGYEFHNINVIDFIEGVLSQINDAAKQYGIKLYFDHGKDVDVSVLIDEQKMGIVLFNLLDNAIQYNVENGQVTVSVKLDKSKNAIVISVQDSGIGISQEELSKIFTKFFRAENAKKTVANGNGLGLYIAKNIVNAHGGDMWVESELNRGTTFFISIPLQRRVASE